MQTAETEFRYSLPSTGIERVESVPPEDFRRLYEQPPGKPVIVTRAIESWPARAKWTFEFFRAQYGADVVTVADRLFRAKVTQRVRLGDYLAYCQFPMATPLAQVASEYPLYLTSFSPWSRHPELLDDFADPEFVDNAYRELEGPLRDWYLNGFSWIFIGPAGTLSPLHIDLFGTHAWLAQLQGRKHFLLFPPHDLHRVYDGAVNFYAPDLERHPLLREALPVEAVIEPGEVIFIPGGWAHQVISLSPSISVTVNYVSRSNLASHVMALTRDLPGWADKVSVPDFRRANRMRWIAEGFRYE
ncbi:MAG: cupin-like domain-containing protein [Bryobacteraceae bacterium]